MDVRDHYHYTKEHEWVYVEDTTATVGITDYAQTALGDITFVELPEIGAEVEQFEQFAAIESVKAANDIYCPLAGKVLEVNKDLDEDPGLVNRDCFDTGWIAKIEVANLDELHKLMDAEEYRNYLESLS